MSRHRVRGPGAAAVALVVAWTAAAGDGRLAAGTHDLRVRIGGEERSYLLHLPPHYRERSPLPLLLAFHGGGGNARGYREYAGLDAVADREGFAVAYPDGSGGMLRRLLTWNAGSCCGRAAREGVDDVAFARAVVADVADRVPIERRRVYATGHSNGAMMSYRLAAEAPDLVAAIAPVAGAMTLPLSGEARPVPVLHVHSVDDPRALYDGGLGPPFPFTKSRVDHNPVERELGRWIALNGCAAVPRVVEQRRDPDSGHTATRLRHAPCSTGATVELWKLRGPGHGWPGATTGRERLVGPSTRVIDAAEEVWRFVSRYERDDPDAPPRRDDRRSREVVEGAVDPRPAEP